jgi:hypothetical protein
VIKRFKINKSLIKKHKKREVHQTKKRQKEVLKKKGMKKKLKSKKLRRFI